MTRRRQADVAIALQSIARQRIERAVVVAIDVLRASSTVVTALANGARDITPFANPEDAAAAFQGQPGKDVLLAGEREGLPPPGFHLGNSPLEFTREAVANRKIFLTTTNGTNLILAAVRAQACLIGCFLNGRAVVEEIARLDKDVILACAGTRGAFSLEDFVAAGFLAKGLSGRGFEFSDSAQAALAAHRAYEGQPAILFSNSQHGRRLEKLGFGRDLSFCSQVDRYVIVPRLKSGEITL